ncbi:GTPaseactivating protein [Pelomyxa schiedti]|nr:GTPaseactivating protein [Pelomyxa schiedti]
MLGNDHSLFFSDPTQDPIVVAIAAPAEGYRKVLVMTKKEDRRFIVPDIQGYLRAIKAACPALDGIKLNQITIPGMSEKISEIERKLIVRRHKLGVLYAKAGQKEEKAFLHNIDTSPEFEHFLELLGDKIELKDWKHYRAGLDIKSGVHGTHSIYTTLHDLEIMFHVCTLMPYRDDDPQQIERKKHIGNDVVVLIFKERSGPDDVIDLSTFVSQFNHVFFCVSPVIPSDFPTTTSKTATTSSKTPITTSKTPTTITTSSSTCQYRVSIAHKPAVSAYPPQLSPTSPPAIYEHGPEFSHFLLTKLINSERAAMESPHFFGNLVKTRRMLLSDVIAEANNS